MFERYNDFARSVVVLSQEAARSLNHKDIDPDHLLLGLLSTERGPAAILLERFGVTSDAVRKHCPTADAPSPSGHLVFTKRSKLVMQTALSTAHESGGGSLTVQDLHLLLALFCIDDNPATDIIRQLGCDPQALCDAAAGQLGMQTPFVATDHRLATMTLSRQAVFDAVALASERQLRDALMGAIGLMNEDDLRKAERNLTRAT